MDTFVARQPIFDRRRAVFGYELLYRDGLANACQNPDHDGASAKVISDGMLVVGLETLVAGRRPFVNVTEATLGADYLSLLPKNAVIEILETVRPTPTILEACKQLKARGHIIALDDFVYSGELEPLLALCDIVKVDWLEGTPSARRMLIADLRKRGIRILAEKIETWEAFRDALDLGCHYFQGYFFSQPEIVRAKEIPTAKLNHLHILREIHRTELDYDAIELVLKRDVSLTVKLLRYINSAAVGLRSEVTSIRHAVILLGPREFRRWASLATVASIATGKPKELIVQASTRGRLCELLAADAGMPERDQELFLIGTFSLLDAVVDRPLVEVVNELALAPELKNALLSGPSPLRGVLDCSIAYERGKWEDVAARAPKIGVPEELVASLYVDAIAWAEANRGDEKAAA